MIPTYLIYPRAFICLFSVLETLAINLNNLFKNKETGLNTMRSKRNCFVEIVVVVVNIVVIVIIIVDVDVVVVNVVVVALVIVLGHIIFSCGP